MLVAGFVTLVFQRIRQPLVLGYLVAGVIVGPHTPPFPLVRDVPNIRTLADLGVIFLMFSLGLEFSFRKLARVGAAALGTALVEVPMMFAIGFGVSRALGYSLMDGVFIGAMLSISSTTIILKTLEGLGLKSRRFAELIFGVLIVEDLVAILILVALSTAVGGGGSLSGLQVFASAGKLLLLVGCWVLSGYFLVPRLIRFALRFQSEETLTVLAVALCLGLVAVATHFGYSAALGAFIMGSVLSESPGAHRIESLVQPIRDVFGAIFFVSVGMLMEPHTVWAYRGTILLFVGLVIVGKLLGVTLGALLSGQRVRPAVMAGFGLAQIGEFSFIIATLGLSMGVMTRELYPIVVSVSLLTTFTTPYLMQLSQRAAPAFERALPRRLSAALERYVAWRELSASQRFRDPAMRAFVVRWLLSGFIVTSIHLFFRKLGVPWLEARWVMRADWAFTLGWLGAILASAPFIWAMSLAFRRSPGDDRPGASRLLLLQLLTLGWLGTLTFSFFPARTVGLVTLGVSVVAFFRFYRSLERSYRWFEKSFLSTFDQSLADGEAEGQIASAFHALAPWDGHLVRLRIHPDSALAGQLIQEAALRQRLGLNIVAIQRGERTIVAPKPEQRLFPRDELLVLGTDDQIESARVALEGPFAASEDAVATLEGYTLRSVFIGAPWARKNRSIRQSGIRENYGAMVVGLERRGRRLMNPDSDLVIEAMDVLWVVGEATSLERLAADFERETRPRAPS